MKSPIIIKNVLPPDVFYALQDDISFMRLSAVTSEGGPLFWCVPDVKETVIPILDMVNSYVKLEMQRHSEYHLDDHEIKVNGATAAQCGSVFHPDIDDRSEAFLSFVLYTAPEWNTQWGGETVIQKPDGDYFYSPYLPNCGVMFPSAWDHYGASPNNHCPILRTSIGFVYKLCYNSPIAKQTTL